MQKQISNKFNFDTILPVDRTMDSSTQYVDEQDATTQILEEEQEQQDPSVEVATLANKFLHASYWFLVLGLTFSSADLADLARVARKRETSCLQAARNLLDTLKTPKLADIVKPDWKVVDGPEEAIMMMGQVQHQFFSHCQCDSNGVASMAQVPHFFYQD